MGLPPLCARNSRMAPWRELRMSDEYGWGRLGPYSMSNSTLAATASCWPTERSRHHAPNSSVYSTSHGMAPVYDY